MRLLNGSSFLLSESPVLFDDLQPRSWHRRHLQTLDSNSNPTDSTVNGLDDHNSRCIEMVTHPKSKFLIHYN